LIVENEAFKIMEYVYAPWRGGYVRKKSGPSLNEADPNDCVFCQKLKDTDDVSSFILRRFKHHAIFLNLYPYVAGHIMIIPNQHVANLADLSPESRRELMELTSACVSLMQQELHAGGVNLGMNLGRTAGAGIPGHLHMHVLPRWHGDTNFLPIIAQTKPISMDLKLVYQDFKPLFDAIVLAVCPE
jgi:ATP adenylyltransferase